MKISVCLECFNQGRLNDRRLDIFSAIKKAAEMGFEGVEFFGFGLPLDSPQAAAKARELKKACADAGLPIASYTVDSDFLWAPGGWEAEVKRLQGEVKLAAELGVYRMRHDGTRGFPEGHKGPTDFAAALPTLVEGCRAVTEFAAGFGIKTMVENHGFFVQDSIRCEQLVRGVDHENFGSLVDFGNFLCADEDSLSAVKRMAPYAFHCHVKDFHVKPAGAPDPGKGWFRSRGGAYLRGAIVGHGQVDVPGCIAALKTAGYKGFASIEFEGMEDSILGLQVGLENMRRYMQG
jgi:sugar phosphate isomerase/epimerase